MLARRREEVPPAGRAAVGIAPVDEELEQRQGGAPRCRSEAERASPVDSVERALQRLARKLVPPIPDRREVPPFARSQLLQRWRALANYVRVVRQARCPRLDDERENLVRRAKVLDNPACGLPCANELRRVDERALWLEDIEEMADEICSTESVSFARLLIAWYFTSRSLKS